ncbi:hypothetical protein [Methanolapillus ohkumae]|uniref:hypothetical protein n=1 Tax=Methanolapillus ohkumae TaxID=3028298 RepID=UPI0030B8A777
MKKEWFLIASLMLFYFIPGINQLIVDHLLSGLENHVLNIAGQIEWFDLFNETLLAFLTVPLYFLFNEVVQDKKALKSRIAQILTVGFVLYALVSIIIYLYASSLTAYMNAPAESVNYLQLETIGFIVGFVFSFIYVLLVVKGEWKLFVPCWFQKLSFFQLAIGF